MRIYNLEGHKVVEAESFSEWAKSFDFKKRVVAKTKLKGAVISTVFFGIDGNIAGPPLVFETMIFGGNLHGYQKKYSTWKEAVKGHKEIIKLLKNN